MIWFMFIFMIEAPLFLIVLENVVHPRHQRKQVWRADGWRKIADALNPVSRKLERNRFPSTESDAM
jgi:hypothetical protein